MISQTKPCLSALILFIFGCSTFAFSQSKQDIQPENVTVQIADFRGKGFDTAGKAAFQASEKDVIVVLVCGAGQDVIDETEAALKGLIHDGYKRVAMILADDHPTPEYNPFVGLIAGGDNPSYMTAVYVHARYAVDLYQSVKSAYEEFILVKMKD
ncbi:MAG: hypothetical protein KDD15_29090 [Lewinella sp.]|nr:hypothetical protein [Lewinella sp.]